LRMQNKILIGLTGGIGSGKSVAGDYISSLGYCVINADEETKKLYFSDKKLKEKLIRTFGNIILSDNGEISKDKLRNIVFANRQNLKRVNAVVHPLAINKINSLAEKASSKIVFVESAILFESGYYKFCYYNVLIYSYKYLRIARVSERDGVSRRSVEKIIGLQMPEIDKSRYADFIIYNNSTRKDFIKALGVFISMLKYIL
jgi:dephospho-CoA kinase